MRSFSVNKIYSVKTIELIEQILRVPSCIAHFGEIRSIEHAQDSLVQACAVVSIGNNSSRINPSINDVLIPLLRCFYSFKFSLLLLTNFK
jgi:hypothetical protein